MAKKRTLFDDRPQEIQELTYIIREDITNLNKQIAHLQGFMKKQQQNQQQNTKAHSANVVVALQSKLANMSSEFKQVLEVRTEVFFSFRDFREIVHKGLKCLLKLYLFSLYEVISCKDGFIELFGIIYLIES